MKITVLVRSTETGKETIVTRRYGESFTIGKTTVTLMETKPEVKQHDEFIVSWPELLTCAPKEKQPEFNGMVQPPPIPKRAR